MESRLTMMTVTDTKLLDKSAALEAVCMGEHVKGQLRLECDLINYEVTSDINMKM